MNSSDSVTEAVDILREVEHWRLSPDRWQSLSPLLDAIAKAQAAGDADALRSAIVDLALAGPTRYTRIGAHDPHQPPPPVVRERVNHLVHALERHRGRQDA